MYSVKKGSGRVVVSSGVVVTSSVEKMQLADIGDVFRVYSFDGVGVPAGFELAVVEGGIDAEMGSLVQVGNVAIEAGHGTFSAQGVASGEIALLGRGCQPFTGVAGRIIVAWRGDCAFVKKAANAQQAGAIALIVVNNEDAVFRMTGDGVFGIPVVVVSQNAASLLFTSKRAVVVAGKTSSQSVFAERGINSGIIARRVHFNVLGKPVRGLSVISLY